MMGGRVIAKAFLLSCVFMWLSGCGGGGDPDDGGLIIGTGIAGTVSENKTLASEAVEVKASTGEKSTASLNRNRRFTQDDVAGDAPYLLRVDLGNGEYRYALSYDRTRTNVNSYSDVIIRSWFAANNLDINSAFSGSGPLGNLPTQQQFDEQSALIFSLVQEVLPEYNVTDTAILSASYDANNQGVDKYLDRNPVVIENRDVSVLLTDPVTNTQTRTRSDLSLNSVVAGVVDTTSPRRVEGVRALGSAVNEIVVVWDPSIDNVGVIAYQVLRDGALVGTTPFPVFTDSGLQPNSAYDYEIVALDAAGGASPESLVRTGTTLAVASNSAPPVPTGLSRVEASAGRVQLRWDLTGVNDIAAFNVYRGSRGQEPELLFRSTSNNVVDPSVTGGTEYCYSVSSVDASFQFESEQSAPPLCFNTDGSVVVPSVVTTETTTGLAIPDVDAVSCTENLPSSIVADLTLSAPCYRVITDVTVGQFADLIIPAGTILKFGQGVGLDITEDGSLAANGTAQQPVVFTGMENARGYWRGIHFNRTESSDNKIINSVIEFAGASSSRAALKVSSTAGERARLRVQGSLIRDTDGYGFTFGQYGLTIDAFEGNSVIDNRQIGYMGSLILPMISSNNNFSNNEEQTIEVPRLTVEVDLVIPDLGVPLELVSGLTISQANLTLDAGVEMLFGQTLDINGGNLIVNGTADNRVVLSAQGRTPGPGDWGGVHLVDSSASRLQYMTIKDGGGSGGRANANLSLTSSFATVQNVILEDSSGYGYVLVDEGSRFSNAAEVQLLNNALQ